MEMKQIIAIRTNDAELLTKIKIGAKRNLIEASMFKIAMLHNLAKKYNIYAFVHLFQIHHDVETSINHLQDAIKKSKSLIKKRLGTLPDITIKVISKQQFGFSNPVHYSLIRLFQMFDECVVWLLIARNSNVFSQQVGFSNLKAKLRKKVFYEFSKIIQINTRDLLNVNFNDYLGNNAIYQEAKSKYGEINPEFLYNAINSSVTPTLSPAEINLIVTKLQGIVRKD